MDAASWRDDAACRGIDTEAFYPVQGESDGPAKAVCARCPVRGECLTESFEHRSFGVWGGMNRDQRDRVRRAHGRDGVHSFIRMFVGRTGVAANAHEPLQSGSGLPYSRPTNTTTEGDAMAARNRNTTASKNTATETPTTIARAKSSVPKDGTAKCGSCRKTLPATKFPTTRTKDGEYVRSTAECRACRDARRAAAKASAA